MTKRDLGFNHEDIYGTLVIIPGFHFYITAINSKQQSSFLLNFKVELMLLLAILNGLKRSRWYFLMFVNSWIYWKLELLQHVNMKQNNKFYWYVKYMKGNRGNWLAQFKFPFLSILWSFLQSYGKVYSFPHFTVFCSFSCFPNNLNYCCQQIKCKEHIKCVQLVIL